MPSDFAAYHQGYYESSSITMHFGQIEGAKSIQRTNISLCNRPREKRERRPA